MEVKEIKAKIWSSLDMYHVKLHFTIYLGFLILGGVMGAMMGSGIDGMRGMTILSGMLIAALSALYLFIPSVLIFFRIIRKPDQYRFYRAVLGQPHGGYPRGTMYFTVVLEEPDGEKFLVNTNTIFEAYGRVGISIEDYVNKTVTIAYNWETENVVVIG